MREVQKNSGLTLVELMVSMAISGLVISAIYGVYTIQQRSYKVQGQVAEMQQKARASMNFMTREIRMAMYDPPNDYPDGNPYDPDGACDDAAILKVEPQEFSFQYCEVTRNPDGSYKSVLIPVVYMVYDVYGDGIKDIRVERKGIKNSLAEGVDALEFRYLDQEGIVTGDIDAIRSVQISILVRSSYPDAKYTDTIEYFSPSGDPLNLIGLSNPPHDNFHRRLLTATVRLRNIGL